MGRFPALRCRYSHKPSLNACPSLYLFLFPITFAAFEFTMATITTPVTEMFGIKHPILLAGTEPSAYVPQTGIVS